MKDAYAQMIVNELISIRKVLKVEEEGAFNEHSPFFKQLSSIADSLKSIDEGLQDLLSKKP